MFWVEGERMEWVIEKAKFEDLPEILALQKLAYQQEGARYNDFTIPPLTQTLEEIQADYQAALILKAVTDGIIIGSIKGRVEQGTCHVGRLMVHPDYQRRGIGRKLLKTLERVILETQDISRFELFTGERSFDNINLYLSEGYRIFRNEPFDAEKGLVFMEKTVGGI
jgi:GNAT superfamily N-acetyltransferase